VVIDDGGDAGVEARVPAEPGRSDAKGNPKRCRHRGEIVAETDQGAKGDLVAPTR
jgi:hypothetical protein